MKRFALALVASLLLVANTASADTGGGFTSGAGAGTTGNGAGVGVISGSGGSGSSSGGSSPYSSCEREDLLLTSLTNGLNDLFDSDSPVSASTSSSVAWLNCTRADNGLVDGFFSGFPLPVVPVDALVAAAQAQLVIVLPEVKTAPPRDGTQLVGVDVWFWVTNSRPATASAMIPGLAATVTARPTATHLRFADGKQVSCTGAGKPYDRDASYKSQHSDCTHIFDFADDQEIDVTVDWALSWTASNGQGGNLAPLPRTTMFTLPLHEAQAVTD